MEAGRRDRMNKKLWAVFTGLTVLTISAIGSRHASAQTVEIKQKPPMYSYIAVWNIPRDQWKARENQSKAARNILNQAIGDGTISAYGFDGNPLHDTFWLTLSKTGMQSVIDQFKKAGITPASAPTGASPAAPPPASILISRYYGWRATVCENAYVHVGIYKMKPAAPPDVVDTLSKHFFAPPLQKMLADGVIFEWETDTYDNPKDGPGTFLIAYLATTSESLAKAHQAVQEGLKSKLPNRPALDSLIDVGASQNVIVRSYAVYK
jgi:hypothetical protein